MRIPKNINTDVDRWGYNDDGKEDGSEVKKYRPNDENGKILMRINIPNGALGCDQIYPIENDYLTGKYLDYNEDPSKSN